MNSRDQAIFRFGEFVLVPREQLLLCRGQSVPLTGRAFQMLVTLVRHAGHLLSKDDLLREVWPGLIVEEVNLTVNVSVLRKALAQSPGGETWIETVPKRGYRFNAPVEIADAVTIDVARLRASQSTAVREVADADELHGRPTDCGAAPTVDVRTAMSASPEAKAPLIRQRWHVRSSSSRWTVAVALLVLLSVSAVWGLLQRKATAEPAYRSVAILPFAVGNPESEYQADGLVEGLINGLAETGSIRITPRGSAFRFKSPIADPVKAGRELAAAAVITGTLTGHGDGARVQVDVIDVSRGAQIWGRSYEAAGSQLMALQGRISEDLVHAMRLPLTPAQRINLIRRPTEDSEAYQAWLQGRYFWSQRSEPGLKRAIEQFRLAIERDPRFALAYAGLADAHATLGYLGYVAPRDTFPEARAFALKALELDPSLAEAHASLGYIKFYFDRDWAGAEAELRRAIALNDRNPVSHQWYAVYLLATGRNDAAFREIQIAHELDPLSLAINTDLGFHHYYNGRYADAISQLESVLKMKGDFLLANLWLGRAYLKVGRFDDALSQFARAEAKVRDWPVLVTARGNAYGVAGRTAEARAVLAEMEALSRTRFVTAYGMALIYAGLRETDPAFEWLDKAFEERSHWLVWLKLDPRWDVLRGDPRFEQLIARMKYPS